MSKKEVRLYPKNIKAKETQSNLKSIVKDDGVKQTGQQEKVNLIQALELGKQKLRMLNLIF